MEITTEQLKSLIEAAVCNTRDYVMDNDGFINDWKKENGLSKDNWIELKSIKQIPNKRTFWHIKTIFPKFKNNIIEVGKNPLTKEKYMYDRMNENNYLLKHITHFQEIKTPD